MTGKPQGKFEVTGTCDKCAALDGPCSVDGDCIDGLFCSTEDCLNMIEMVAGGCCKMGIK